MPAQTELAGVCKGWHKLAGSSTFGAEFGLLVKRRRAERGLSQDNLAAILGAGITKSEISRLESGRIASPQESTVLRYCEALGIREDEVNALRLAPPLPPKDLLSLIAEINAANRDALNNLAVEFLIDTPANHSDVHLRKLLIYKAQEFKALTESLAQLHGKSTRLDNLLPAIEAAVAEKRLSAARALLADAREIQIELLRPGIEANANLLEIYAQIDLLENNPDAAYCHYKTAAASFAAIAPVESSHRHNNHAKSLYDHGLHFGGSGLLCAIDLLRANLQDLSQVESPEDWAKTQNNLANSLSKQAERTEGAEGADLLKQAVEAYDKAMQVYTLDAYPTDWAMTQNNFAVALVLQAAISEGAEGVGLLERAVTAHVKTLQVYTRNAHPTEWAMTQNNFAIALRNLAARKEGAAGVARLKGAIAAYRKALQVYTRDLHPTNWAMTQNNLAAALCSLASRTEGETKVALLKDGVATFCRALQVYTSDSHPTHWAMTMENLAITHLDIAHHSRNTSPVPELREALAAVDAALTVFDPVHMAHYHTSATDLRETILLALKKLKIHLFPNRPH
jgi:transcriptional regulator with XRE-family HTH domain